MGAVVLFWVVAVCLFFFAGDNHSSSQMLANEAALAWTFHALGGLIAATAAFVLLLRGIAGETLQRQMGLVIPLLAGLTLTNAHWSVSLALAAFLTALIARSIFHRPTAPVERQDIAPKP